MSQDQSTPSICVEPLSKAHRVKKFDCGETALNKYLIRYALKNDKTGVAKAYVAVQQHGSSDVLGFYTLSAGSVNFESLPATVKLPKYPVPIVRLGRMGVQKSKQGTGVGSYLLSDAMNRVLQTAAKIGIYALIVDAKNENAKTFYKRFGFIEFQDAPLSLFLPVETILTAVSN